MKKVIWLASQKKMKILYFQLILTAAIVIPTTQVAATIFFNPSQIATPVSSGTTSDTISSEGYLFTYTRDKLFTGGVGMTEPIGRYVRVPWPDGLEAQAVTTGPNLSGGRIDISRVDGAVFDLTAFTAKLLGNTAGTGANIEIMPILNGEDAFNDPIYFDASGYYGMSFSYDTSPNYLGSTALLKGFEAYKIGIFVDFALTGLTLETILTPSLTGTVDLLDFVGDKTIVPVSVEFGGTSYPLNLDANGTFTIFDVAAGTYDVRIKASNWLGKMTAGVVVAGDTIMDPVSLINGDVVDNNEVDFSDINAVRDAYGSFPGDLTWNDRADVDGSLEVDFTDINIVRSNYGAIGE